MIVSTQIEKSVITPEEATVQRVTTVCLFIGDPDQCIAKMVFLVHIGQEENVITTMNMRVETELVILFSFKEIKEVLDFVVLHMTAGESLIVRFCIMMWIFPSSQGGEVHTYQFVTSKDAEQM